MRLSKVNVKPGRSAAIVLPILPFIVCLILYSLTSYIRHDGTPNWISSMGSKLLISMELQQSDLEDLGNNSIPDSLLQELEEGQVSLIFSTGLMLQSDLDDGSISEDLRREFGNGGISLSDDVNISIEREGEEWLITDKDKELEYTVKKEVDKLNVYRLLFSQDATVSTREENRRWRIIDESNSRTYSVRKEADKLSVYRNVMPYFATKRVGNPKDPIVPRVMELVDGVRRTTLEPDRKGERRLLVDTIASTRRFAIGVAFLFLGVIFGLHMGMLPYAELSFYRFVLFVDKIPALAILPILFIVFGLGEVSKIALIILGVMPTIILDTYLRAKAIPKEQITKALTLKASNFEIMYRIVLPRIFPKVLDTIRLNFKSVFLFLIAGESLAATVGLGYRIFVVRRYVAMDIIIPYVIWISLLAFLADLGVRIWIKKRYTWLDKQ